MIKWDCAVTCSLLFWWYDTKKLQYCKSFLYLWSDEMKEKSTRKRFIHVIGNIPLENITFQNLIWSKEISCNQINKIRFVAVKDIFLSYFNFREYEFQRMHLALVKTLNCFLQKSFTKLRHLYQYSTFVFRSSLINHTLICL